MDSRLKRLLVTAVFVSSLSSTGAVVAQGGGYGGGWNSGQQPQQGMMGNMMNQGRMMQPGYMMGQGGMMQPGYMMGQGGMMQPGHMMGQGGMMNPGHMMSQMTQQQRNALEKLNGEFLPMMGEVQGKMMAGQQRLRALFSAEEIDQAELDSAAAQMGDLMAEMIKLRVQHMARIRSLMPDELRQQMRQ